MSRKNWFLTSSPSYLSFRWNFEVFLGNFSFKFLTTLAVCVKQKLFKKSSQGSFINDLIFRLPPLAQSQFSIFTVTIMSLKFEFSMKTRCEIDFLEPFAKSSNYRRSPTILPKITTWTNQTKNFFFCFKRNEPKKNFWWENRFYWFFNRVARRSMKTNGNDHFAWGYCVVSRMV